MKTVHDSVDDDDCIHLLEGCIVFDLSKRVGNSGASLEVCTAFWGVATPDPAEDDNSGQGTLYR